jgi:hypothetical protein
MSATLYSVLKINQSHSTKNAEFYLMMMLLLLLLLLLLLRLALTLQQVGQTLLRFMEWIEA